MGGKLFNRINKNKQKINFFLVTLIAVTIPFSVSAGNTALIIAAAFNIVFFDKKKLKKLSSYVLIFPIIFFLIFVLWAIFGYDFSQGISRADRHFIPVLLTIILINQNLNAKELNKIFSYYYVAVTLATSILLIVFIYGLMQRQSIYELTFHNFSALYDQHPVYFSLYISMAMVYLIGKGFKQFSITEVLGIPILLAGLVLSASKAVLFVDIVMLLVYFFIHEKSLRGRITSILAIIILAFGILMIGFINDRFKDGLTLHHNIINFNPTNDFTKKPHFDIRQKENITDLELRYLMASISIYHLVQDKNILFGYGPGAAQDYLDYYLYTYNLGPNWYQGFNVHNQYIHLLLNYGVFVLGLFLLYLVFCFKGAIREKNYFQLAFLVMIAFVFLFEVLLVRNKGILFFYFFNILFLTNTRNFEISHTRH